MFQSTLGHAPSPASVRRFRLLWFLLPLAGALSAGPSLAQQTETVDSPAEEQVEFNEDVALATFDEAWSIINETHFDPEYLQEIGWEQVREELRPQAAEAQSNDDLREVIHEMLERLGQSHFALIPAEAADVMEPDDEELDDSNADSEEDADSDDVADQADDGIDGDDADDEGEASEDECEEIDPDTPGAVGFDVRWLEGRFLVTTIEPDSPAERAGVRPGWIVQSVNDRNLQELMENFPEDLEPRWRDLAAWQVVRERLGGPTGSKVEVSFLDHDDEPLDLKLRREPRRGEPSKLGNLPTFYAQVHTEPMTTPGGHTAGLIAFNIWMVPVMHPVREAIDRFRDADGIIIDLRGNPGGIGGLSMGVAGFFIDDRRKFGTMKTRGGELNFVAFPQRLSAAGELVEPFSGPVALLVDGLSGSTSEVFAGGMQSIGRMRVFGTTTMGAALPAAMPRLPNGDVLLHAFADFVDANGVRMEGRGVVPDEEVVLDRAVLLSGHDPVLSAALDWIDEESDRQRGDG